MGERPFGSVKSLGLKRISAGHVKLEESIIRDWPPEEYKGRITIPKAPGPRDSTEDLH